MVKLKEIHKAGENIKALRQAALAPEQLTDFQNRYIQIVAGGLLANPAPERTEEQTRKR